MTHSRLQLRRVLLTLLNELREKYGTALFYISHNLGVIAQVCDRIAVMQAGRIVATGTPENVAANKESFTGRFLAPLLVPAKPVKAKRKAAG